MRCCGLNFQSLLTLTLASGVTWGQGGLIVTSGGDAFGLAPPGPAGSVTLEAEAALDLPAAASALNVAVGETLDLAPGVHDFSEIRVAGTLRLAGDAILRSSGPVVIDGAVVGRQGPQGTDGAELTILGLGPFHLTGTLDCSGA
ncbi:MAG: hypothetical protein HY721_12485, partial [Planctomycetes bacterium]|nr:hypothetical protein [Planctomycetota bacterium]